MIAAVTSPSFILKYVAYKRCKHRHNTFSGMKVSASNHIGRHAHLNVIDVMMFTIHHFITYDFFLLKQTWPLLSTHSIVFFYLFKYT